MKYHTISHIDWITNEGGKTSLTNNKIFHSDDVDNNLIFRACTHIQISANLYNILKPWLHHIGVL